MLQRAENHRAREEREMVRDESKTVVERYGRVGRLRLRKSEREF